MGYVAPDPTPEQIQNAAGRWDPYDLLGISNYWAMPPDHPLAAAGTIHDEMYLYALTPEQRAIVDHNFARDCRILAAAHPGFFDEIEARVFPAIVIAVSPIIDTSIDRNTDITRDQGLVFMVEAKRYVNECAALISFPCCPYPQVGAVFSA